MEILNFQDWGNPKSFWKGLIWGLITFFLFLIIIK
jgi:hypothetical protein